MKRLKTSINFSMGLLFLGLLLFTGNSCSKNEIPYEDAAGILTCRFKLSDGRVFDCSVDQIGLKVANSQDSLLFGTSTTVLSKIKPIFTTTIGAKVYADGKEVKSGETELDLTKVIKLEAVYNGAKRDYSLQAYVERQDHSQTSGSKVNTDMTLTGLPAFNSYSAAYFKSKLYILGAYYPGGTSATATAYYELYTSSDGAQWTKVNTTPNVVGGFGAVLTVLGDKLFAVGGTRTNGTDVNGVVAPDGWSIAWRIMSSTNGTDWTDCTPGQVNAPSGRAFPQVCIHNGKLLLRRGKTLGFGMWQNQQHSDIFQTSDGTTWTKIPSTPTTATNRTEDAMFSFGNKLWIVGGYKSYISASNILDDIWSSADNGLTWQQETGASGVDMKRFGHNVISYNGKLYMIGGEMMVGSTRTGVSGVLSSSDAVHWTKLPDLQQLPVAFSSRIYSNVFMGEGDLIWIIGGFANSSGNYTIGGITMPVKYDAWTKRLK